MDDAFKSNLDAVVEFCHLKKEGNRPTNFSKMSVGQAAGTLLGTEKVLSFGESLDKRPGRTNPQEMILFLKKVNRLFELMNSKTPMRSCAHKDLIFMDEFLADLAEWERTAELFETGKAKEAAKKRELSKEVEKKKKKSSSSTEEAKKSSISSKEKKEKLKSSLPTKEVMYDIRLLMKGVKAFAKIYLPTNEGDRAVTHVLKQFVPMKVLLFPRVQSSDACENFFSQARALGGGARNLLPDGVERAMDNHSVRTMGSYASTHVDGANCAKTDEMDAAVATSVGVQVSPNCGSSKGSGKQPPRKKRKKTVDTAPLTKQRERFLALGKPPRLSQSAPSFWALDAGASVEEA
jgi:hypothetical protein